MKIGTFVLGGLAGAAIVMIMRNRAMSAVTGSLGQLLMQRLNDMKETAIQNGITVKFGGRKDAGARNGASANHAGMHHAGADKNGGLDKVGHLASQDSKVKREVNEILSESNQHNI